MSNEKKLVPESRFPEFDGQWEERIFEDLFEIGNGRDYKHLNPGDIPVYGSGGYMLSVDDYLYDGESACIGRKGTIDKPMFLSGKFWTVDTLFYTHSFDGCLPKYIYYVFQNIDWLKHNEAGGVPSLSKANIYQIKTSIPLPSEQQKIVSCLSSLDNLIAANNDKLEGLKNHKKGLMQNLFPQDGKLVPALRFKEFEDDGEWLEDTLENLCTNISSGRDRNSDIGEYNLYGSTGIIGKTSDASYEGDYILVARVGANAGTLNRGTGLYGVTDNTLVIDLKRKESLAFVFFLLNTVNLKNLVFGSGQPLITGGQLKNVQVLLPKSTEEQNKIASVLSTLDDLIITQAEKISQLQLHKKGLMQQLFPKAN